MHGSPLVCRRWRRVGLVAGETGTAPLFQIAGMLLDDPGGYTREVGLLFVNRREEDILLRDEIEDMVEESGGRFRVTYSITGGSDSSSVDAGIDTDAAGELDAHNRDATDYQQNTATARCKQTKDTKFEYIRGSTDIIQKALPPPHNKDGTTMVLVCGTDGFVDWWSGPVARGPPKEDGTKGAKIQGPLLGLLRDAGYDESEVFKY